MGTLATWLQNALAVELPSKWRPRTEVRILPAPLADRYGFSPCADLHLEGDGYRVVVELEISRADPVSNHVKFLIARDAGELGERDIFVSMMSPHIVPGRRNIGAAFTQHMRAEGHCAFQVALLPEVAPDEVATLNHSSPERIARRRLPIAREAERLLSVIEPRGHRIHFAGDVSEVISNLWTWNAGVRESGWTRRRVQYFVFDPISQNFAPSKFCAFIPATQAPTMTFALYGALDESDPRFDGHRARKHLMERLAFREVPLAGELQRRFHGWLALVQNAVAVRPPVRLLLPPSWYR